MNPDNQASEPEQPRNPQMPQESFASRYAPQQPTTPRTSATFPWTPMGDGPHPAQPASPVSSEHFTLPPPPQRPDAPAGTVPQFGGQMAELPPLTSDTSGMTSSPSIEAISTTPNGLKPVKVKKSRPHVSVKWVLGILIGLAFVVLITAAVLVAVNTASKKTSSGPGVSAITYIDSSVKKIAHDNQLTAASVAQLNKTNAFYSAFRIASQAPVVQTTWDVYYTPKQSDLRADQYNLYGVSIDYRSKKYTYNEDDYSSLGVIQSRCIGGKEYILSAGQASDAAASWQPASDNSSCQISRVVTHTNDGLNTGGLSASQSDAFVQALNKSHVVTVSQLALVTQNKVQYLRFDIDITPQLKAPGIYWGMQNMLSAFQATGLNADKQPYSYFGSSGEGAHVAYYVDPGTMLPVYSTMVSTPAFNRAGKPITPSSWSHRAVEYTFPTYVPTLTLGDHAPIAFDHWPDH